MEITLGKRIVQNRKRLGLTQDQLAEQLGVTAQAVSKWENDQSCPDISMLPRLAEIFGITTDALLGRQEPPTVHEAEIVDEDKDTSSDVGGHVGKWEFRWDSGRRSALGFALLMLVTGGLLLLSKLLSWSVSFWEILWPTALLLFSLVGFAPKFSFFRLGCVLFGGYFLLDNLDLLPFALGGELLFPALVILFGLSLLADALKKPAKPKFKAVHKGRSDKMGDDYSTSGESFSYNASFGESRQDVVMPRLSQGQINTSFGEFVVDLSGVETVTEDCQIEANCSFAELTILVPSRFRVQSTGSTAFAEVNVGDHPDVQAEGVIRLSANASFGEICVRYI